MAYDDAGSILALMYDADYAAVRQSSGDIDFYVAEAKRAGGAYLEFGCGTGRILGPVAEAGIEACGIDSSAAMLDQARRKLGSGVVLHQVDMREADLRRTFALVTIPFRALCHLSSPEDHVRALRAARRHLDEGGRLLFDLFQPDPRFLAEARGETLQLERTEEGRRIRRYATAVPHVARQESDVRFRWEICEADGTTREESCDFVMRWLHRFEVEHALARAGFALDALYGDFDRSPLTNESREMIFAARALPE